MATEHCPECGEPIGRGVKSCACGWSSKPRETKASEASADSNRCTFQIGERRCRYNATIFENQTRTMQHGVCGGHFRPSPQSAEGTLSASEHDAGTPDYSTAAQVAETLRRYLASDRYAPSAAERQVEKEIPRSADGVGDWWARRILRLHELGHPLPQISVAMARQVIRQKSASTEDLLERAAIQGESAA